MPEIYEPELKNKTLWELMFNPDQYHKYGLRGWYYIFLGLVIAALSASVSLAKPHWWEVFLFISFFISLAFIFVFYVKVNDQEELLNERKKKLSDELKAFLKCQEFQYELEELIDKLKKDGKQPINLTRVLSTYRTKVIEPRKLRGSTNFQIFMYDEFNALADDDESLYEEVDTFFRDPEGEDEQIDGIAKIKEQLRILEMRLARNLSIPFASAIFTTAMFLLYGLAGLLDPNTEIELYFGVVHLWTTGLTAVLMLLAIFFLLESFTTIKPTEQGIKLVLGKPYKLVSRGLRFTPWKIVTIRSFPMTIMYYNVDRDKTLLVGEESQSVSTNISQPYRYTDLWDVIDGLGDNPEEVKKLLEGESGNVNNRGMIGDKVVTVVRSLIADETQIQNLDAALQMRKNLASALKKQLNKDYGHLGVQFDVANTTDIEPEPGMVEGRNKKALTKIDAETAKIEVRVADHKAKAGIKTAGGKAKEKMLTGTAEANVDKLMGEANATVVLAKLKAHIDGMKYLKDTGSADEAIPMIATMIMAEKSITEIAKALNGIGINIYQVDGSQKIIDMIKSATGLGSLLTSSKSGV